MVAMMTHPQSPSPSLPPHESPWDRKGLPIRVRTVEQQGPCPGVHAAPGVWAALGHPARLRFTFVRVWEEGLQVSAP